MHSSWPIRFEGLATLWYKVLYKKCCGLSNRHDLLSSTPLRVWDVNVNVRWLDGPITLSDASAPRRGSVWHTVHSTELNTNPRPPRTVSLHTWLNVLNSHWRLLTVWEKSASVYIKQNIFSFCNSNFPRMILSERKLSVWVYKCPGLGNALNKKKNNPILFEAHAV